MLFKYIFINYIKRSFIKKKTKRRVKALKKVKTLLPLGLNFLTKP